MTQIEKTLQKMRNNPRDWRIEDLKAIADRFGLKWRQKGTSHVVFVREDGRTLPVPAHKPIKPVYVTKFLLLLEELPCE